VQVRKDVVHLISHIPNLLIVALIVSELSGNKEGNSIDFMNNIHLMIHLPDKDILAPIIYLFNEITINCL